jgi:hypothetical protein
MARHSALRLGGLLVLAASLLGGCQTRSISDSGYHGEYGGGSPLYHGELTAYDVIGVDRDRVISDRDIQQALVAKQAISVKKGSAIMLVQSGAPFPDPEMMTALQRYYAVSSFTGIPLVDTHRSVASDPAPPASYSQLFRLAAAKGGFETIVVYWGVLESASEGLGTKAISWVPIIGGAIPDQTQHMRIRLMLAVIDVRTGQWETFNPPPFDDEATSNAHGRAASDQTQVALLKAKAYAEAADAFAARYGR